MEIHHDTMEAPTFRKKGLSSTSKVQFGKDVSKLRKKKAGFDQNTLFSDNGSISKPQTPGASLASAKTPKSGKPRRALGDISNRKLELGESGRKDGKGLAASQVSFKVVAKPLFKPEPEYEYPDIELSAGNLGDVEDDLVAKLQKNALPDDFPFPKDFDGSADAKSSKSPKKKISNSKKRVEKLSVSHCDEVSDDGLAIGASLLNDDELDLFLQDGTTSDFFLTDAGVDMGPICDSSFDL
mmetsp:Transcript_48571/g.97716  ORF Transcript_48571/g.97716 Transcript_48571/m.97716 type:complete len:240 (-) Transcript_48571:249-968(-)